ncbi:MAG: hypothetical protein U1E65_15240 [Myxococcota bacterium]
MPRALWLCLLALPARLAAGDPIVLEDGETLLTADDRSHWLNRSRCLCGESLNITLDLSSFSDSGKLALVSGKSCLDSDKRISSSCRTLWSGARDGKDSRTLSVSASEIAGGCDAQSTTLNLSLVSDPTDADQWTSAASLAIGVDTDPPPAPSASQVVAGEGLAEVAFSLSDDSDIQKAQVLCQKSDGSPGLSSAKTAGFDSAFDRCGDSHDSGLTKADACAEAAEGSASVTVTGLANQTTYTFWVVSIDASGNASPRTEVGTVTPAPEEDFWERYQRSGGLAEGTGCSASGGPGGSAVLSLVFWAFSRRGRRC